MKIGSPEHRDTFCTHFTQTYTEYDPKTLPWPDLDDDALQRLKSVPFWEEVFYTERRAGAIVAAFTETISDPVMKEAVALQGQEETRHAKLIRVMIEKYGLDAAERPMEDVGDIETASRISVSANAWIPSWVSASSRSRGSPNSCPGRCCRSSRP